MLVLVPYSVLVLSFVRGLVFDSVLALVPVSAPPLPFYLSLPIPYHASDVSDCSRSTNEKETKTDKGGGRVKTPIGTSTTVREQLRQCMVRINTTVD